jgi:glycosyltransferase involved in cell wall biosynthesis
LRILYAGTLPPHQGGSALLAGQLLIELARRGHEIVAVSPIAESAAAAGDPMASRGIDIRRVLMAFTDNSPDRPPSEDYEQREGSLTLELVEQALAERPFDLLLVGRESFVPYVADLHSLPRVLIVAGTTIAGIDNGRYPRERAEPVLAAIREFDLVLTSAEPVVRTMADLGVPAVQVIRNPVDTTVFHPGPPSPELRSALGITDRDIVVAHASNMKAQKRPLDIVEAAALALARDERLLFVIAGDGALRAEMEAECERRGLSDRFRFIGWIDHGAVADLFRTAQMLVMPSWFEAQALVYLEAQACGCPLVVSDIPAARVVVEDGATGLIFALGDPAGMADRIVALAADADLRRRLAANALDQVQAHALPRVADEYETQFTSLLAQRASSS